MRLTITSWFSAAAALAALLVAPGALATPAASIGPDTPSVVLVPDVKVKIARVYASDRGWSKCSRGLTHEAPALFIDVAEGTPEVSIRLERPDGAAARGQDGIILTPDKKGFFCLNKDMELYLKDPAPGRWEVWFASISIGAGGHVRVEIPSRTGAEVRALIPTLPTIGLADDGVNPRFFDVPATRPAAGMDLGVGCYKSRDGLMPIARIDNAAGAQLKLRVKPQGFLLTDEAGASCHQGDVAPAGASLLWAKVNRNTPPESFHVELDDLSRPLGYGAPLQTEALGELPGVVVLEGTVREPAPRPTRQDRSCRVPNHPDLVLSSGLLQDVELELLYSGAKQRLAFVDPAIKRTHGSVQCSDKTSLSYEIFEGDKAYWVTGDVGSTWRLAVRRSGFTPPRDELVTAPPAADELGDDLGARMLARYYPFLGRGRAEDAPRRDLWRRLFVSAPEQLFVYPRAPLKAKREGGPPGPGEPLLLMGKVGGDLVLVDWEGATIRADARLITAARPDAIALPTTPPPSPSSTLGKAMKRASAGDRPAIDKFSKLEDKFVGCVGDYLRKHDPTWGTDYEVFRISGDRVTNVAKQVGKRANRKCGEAKVERAGERLKTKLDKGFAARRAAALAEVRARFGL